MNTEPPLPRSWRASDKEAIELCQQWMAYLGAEDVVAASGEGIQVCDLYSRIHRLGKALPWVGAGQTGLPAPLSGALRSDARSRGNLGGDA
jgi:hypothetical protein